MGMMRVDHPDILVKEPLMPKGVEHVLSNGVPSVREL